MDAWVTRVREEINGVQVNITISGKGCIVDGKTKEIISKALKKGRRSGMLGIEQPDRGKTIVAGWSVPFDAVAVGDKVRFSTSGKYNPGYSATETYEGVVEKISDEDKYIIKTEEHKSAVVPLKHIEKIL